MYFFSHRIAFGILFTAVVFLALPVSAQTGDSLSDYNIESRLPKDEAAITKGRQLFQQHCSQCHMIQYELIGPALASIGNKRPLPWLHRFIRNSQEVIRGGDAYAGGLYGRYNNIIMPPFEFLSDREINQMLAYIKQESTMWVPTAGANPRVSMERGNSPAAQSLTTGDVLDIPVRETTFVDNDLQFFTIVMWALIPITLAIFTWIAIKLFHSTTKH